MEGLQQKKESQQENLDFGDDFLSLSQEEREALRMSIAKNSPKLTPRESRFQAWENNREEMRKMEREDDQVRYGHH